MQDGKSKSQLFIIFTTIFVDLIGFGIVLPLLPFYADHFGAPPYAIGFLVASFSLMQFIFAPLWGRLSDRVGRRPIILISLVGSSLSYLFFGLAGSLFMLFATRIFAGIASASISVAQAYITDVTTPENRARGMGVVGAAFGLGFIFGPIIGGLLSEPSGIFHSISIASGAIGTILGHPQLLGSAWLDTYGLSLGKMPHYDIPAYFAAALCFGNVTLAYFRLPESLPESLRKKDRKLEHPFSVNALRSALRHPRVGRILLLSFLLTFCIAVTHTTFPLFFRATLHIGTVENGYLLTLLGVVSVIMQGFLVGRFVKKFGERVPVVSGFAILIAGFFLLGLTSGWTASILGLILMGIGSGLTTPLLLSILTKITEAGEHGGILGLNASISSLARVIGPVWGGISYSYYGFRSPFVTAGGVLVITFIVSLGLLAHTYATIEPVAEFQSQEHSS